MKASKTFRALFLGITSLVTFDLEAVTSYTNTTADSWSTAGNWSGGVVPSGSFNQRININGGTTVTFGSAQGTVTIGSSVSAEQRPLVLAPLGTSGTATLNITGGTLQANSGATGFNLIGANADNTTGLLNVSGGLLDLTTGSSNAQHLAIGLVATTSNARVNGTVTLSGNGTVKVNGFVFNEGAALTSGTGTVNGILNLNGGTMEAAYVRESTGTNQAHVTSTVNFNGGLLKLTSSSGGISNSITNANVLAGGAIIEVGASINATVAKALSAGSPGGGLTKRGAGTLTLTQTNTYSGTTTVSEGTLALSAGGSVANSSGIHIDSGATLSITGLTSSSYTLGAAQTLSGSGTILATGKTLVANGTLSAGSSPGSLIQDGGILQLGAGGDLNWQVYDASGSAGTGYDTVQLINGAVLDLSLLSSLNPYQINLWSLAGIGPDANGNATNFDQALSYAWTLFSQDTAISGFDESFFAIQTGSFNGAGGFQNDLGGGMFRVGLGSGGNSIVLNFTPVPEPSVAMLGGLGLCCLLRRRRR